MRAQAAAEQLEAAQGVQETPFVTIRVSLERQAPEEGGEGGAEEGKEGKEGAAKPAAKEGEMVTHFDAFQVCGVGVCVGLIQPIRSGRFFGVYCHD